MTEMLAKIKKIVLRNRYLTTVFPQLFFFNAYTVE